MVFFLWKFEIYLIFLRTLKINFILTKRVNSFCGKALDIRK